MNTLLDPSPWAAVVTVSGVFLLGVLAVVRGYRSTPGSRLFAVVVGLSAVYALGYAAQVLAPTLGGKLLWLKLQFLGIAFIPVASLVFALDYTGRTGWVTPRSIAALSVVPAVSVAGIWLDPGPGLVVADPHLVEVGAHADLEYAFGPLGLVAWAYVYLLLLVVLLLFLGLAVRGRPAYRIQGWLLFLAYLAPVAVAAWAILTPSVLVDPTPLGLVVTGVLVTWGVFRSEFLDVVPVDRDRTLDRIRGAVVVLDTDGRLVDANRTAREAFGEAVVVGRGADELLAEAGFEESVADLVDGTAVTKPGEDPRRYEVSRDEIETWYGDYRGSVLTLYEVTERWRAQRRLAERTEQLTVLNRFLRHDIRNDTEVVLGWTEALRDDLGPEHETAVEHLLTAARHITDVTETARELTDALVEDETDLERVRLDPVVAEAVEAARSRYPEAAFEAPDAYPPVTVRANDLLTSVFRNLLNNAVQHNDGDPEVTVLVEDEGELVRVVVADNGPGIPDATDPFERGLTGTDSDGTGIGLYLVGHLVDRFGGDVDARPNDPRGTRMVVTLPVAD